MLKIKFPTIYSCLFMRKGKEVLSHTPLSLSKLSHFETLNVTNITNTTNITNITNTTNTNYKNPICYTECFCMIDDKNKKHYKGLFMWSNYTSNIIITPITPITPITIYPFRKKYYERIYFNPSIDVIDVGDDISQYHASIDNYRVRNINPSSLNGMTYIQQDCSCFRL